MQKKKLMVAFAAATALISTPSYGAEAYTLRNNYGAEINVLEMSQREARQILQDVLPSQDPNQNLTLQESYRLKTLYNWHFRDSVAPIARQMGFPQGVSMSLANALTYLYGRYIVEKNGDMSFQAYEYDPNKDAPVNGYSPGAQPGLLTLPDGSKYAICGVATADPGHAPESWYRGFTNVQVADGLLPDSYARYFMEQSTWHERAHCFFEGDEAKADYFATLQMLNTYYGSDELPAVKQFFQFKVDMILSGLESGYLAQSMRHVPSALLAALESFEQQSARMSQEEIWTWLTDQRSPSEERLESMRVARTPTAIARTRALYEQSYRMNNVRITYTIKNAAARTQVAQQQATP